MEGLCISEMPQAEYKDSYFLEDKCRNKMKHQGWAELNLENCIKTHFNH